MNSVSFITWAYKLIAQLAIALARLELALARISTALLCYYLLFTIYYIITLTSCFYYYYTNYHNRPTGILCYSGLWSLVCQACIIPAYQQPAYQHTRHTIGLNKTATTIIIIIFHVFHTVFGIIT